MTNDPSSRPQTDKEMREARLAEALRQNLKRRKEQTRARRSSAEVGGKENAVGEKAVGADETPQS